MLQGWRRSWRGVGRTTRSTGRFERVVGSRDRGQQVEEEDEGTTSTGGLPGAAGWSVGVLSCVAELLQLRLSPDEQNDER